jgi:hypothetical protein
MRHSHAVLGSRQQRGLFMKTLFLVSFLLTNIAHAQKSYDYQCILSDRTMGKALESIQTVDILLNEGKDVSLRDGKTTLSFSNYGVLLAVATFGEKRIMSAKINDGPTQVDQEEPNFGFLCLRH